MKKIIAFLLLVVLTVQLISVGAAYANNDTKASSTLVTLPGSGTVDDPFLIEDEEHLLFFAKQVNSGNGIYKNAHYSLQKSVKLTGEWTPIGNNNYPFGGTFNGNGFTVSGLVITKANIFSGLFGYSTGNILNVTVDLCYIKTTGQYCGAITAYNGGKVVNCHSSVDITVNNTDRELGVGGIVGVNFGSVYYCSSKTPDHKVYDITVNSQNNGGSNTIRSAQGGGLVGLNFGKVNTCFSTINVLVQAENPMPGYAGGLVGFNSGGNITECYAKGNVAVNYCDRKVLYEATAGGLVASNNSGRIVNCFALGDVKTLYGDAMSSHNIGGLVGVDNSGIIKNCYRYKYQTVELCAGINVYPLSPGTISNYGEEHEGIIDFYYLDFLSQMLQWNRTNWVEVEGDTPVFFGGSDGVGVYTLDKVNDSGALVLEYNTLDVLSDASAPYDSENNVLKLNCSGYYEAEIKNCTLFSHSRLAMIPKSTNSNISAVHCDGTDGLANEVYLALGSKGLVDLYVYPAKDASVVKYQLIEAQELYPIPGLSRVIYESEDGKFSIKPIELEDDDTYWVRAIGTDGTVYAPIRVNLRVVEPISSEDINDKFDLGLDELAIDIPKDIPLIGGKEIKIGVKELPLSVIKEPDKLLIAMGSKTLTAPDYSPFKEAIEKFNQGIVTSKAKEQFYSGPDENPFSFKFYGYLEIPIDSHGNLRLNTMVSKMIFTIAGEWDHQWQCYAFSIPIVLKVKLEASASSTLYLQCDNNWNFDVSGAIKIEAPSITPSVGVGIIDVFDVSVYGKATHTLDMDIRSKRVLSTIKGEVGLSASLLFFEAKESLLSGQMTIYDSNKKTLLKGLRSNIVTAFTNKDNYIINRDYNSNTSEWGDETASFMYSTISGDEKILQSSVYNSAAPQAVKLSDGTIIMVWTADIAERSDYNHTAIVWSRYTPDTGKWSSPAIIEDDGTADFMPSVVSDGEKTYVAWIDTNTTFDGEVDIDVVASCCEVTYAVLSFGADSFGEAVRLTVDSFYDYSVELSLIDGVVYVAWLSNSANDVMMINGTNNINLSVLGGGCEVSSVIEADAPITDFALGKHNDEISIIYAVDEDSNFDTLGSTIYLANISDLKSAFVVGRGVISNLTPASYKGTDGFFAYLDGYLVFIGIDESAEKIMSLSSVDNFVILETENGLTLLYTASNPSDIGGSSAYVVFYDREKWSRPVVLTESDCYIDSLSAIVNEYGDFNVFYTKTAAEIVDGILYKQSNICTNTIYSKYDITLSEAYFTNVSADGHINVELTVKNNGFYAVDDYVLAVYNSKGEIVHSETIYEHLDVGEVKDKTVTMPIPAVKDIEDFSVSVLSLGIVDSYMDDNKVFIELGASALSVNASRLTSGNSTGVAVKVRNNGIREEDVVLNVRKESREGEILSKYFLGTVSPGETAEYVLEPSRFRSFVPDNSLFVFEVCGNTEEEYTADNYSFVVIEQTTFKGGDGREYPYYYDVNSDGGFNVLDLIALKRVIMTASSKDAIKYDFNGDLVVNNEDVSAFAELLVN